MKVCVCLNMFLYLYFRISDAGLRPFLEGSSGTKLRELNFATCIHVTDASLMKIAQRYCIIVTPVLIWW